MTIPSSPTGALMGVASLASTPGHVTYLRRCRLNLVDVLLQSVSNFGRMLFTLTIWSNMATCISSMTDLAGGLMNRCLVL